MGFAVECAVRAVLVVFGAEPVELGLQLGDGGRGGLFREPAFLGLVEAFDLSLGLEGDSERCSVRLGWHHEADNTRGPQTPGREVARLSEERPRYIS